MLIKFFQIDRMVFARTLWCSRLSFDDIKLAAVFELMRYKWNITIWSIKSVWLYIRWPTNCKTYCLWFWLQIFVIFSYKAIFLTGNKELKATTTLARPYMVRLYGALVGSIWRPLHFLTSMYEIYFTTYLNVIFQSSLMTILFT